MSRFKQAAPDPEKAARDGVANYVPARRQPNLDHECGTCERTATWEIQIDGQKSYACADCRAELAIVARGVYQERRL